jgi:lipoprotein NlpD
MAKTFPMRWTSVICLALLLGACAHARIVRRDYPEEESAPPPRHVAATPTPVKHLPPPQSQPVVPKPQTAAQEPVSPEAIPQSETYIVKAGDTLYGLARRFGLKFKDLADWNKIAEPYAIQSGQRLHLHSASAGSTVETPKPAATVSAPNEVSSNSPVSTAPVATNAVPSVAGTSAPSSTVNQIPKPTTTANAPAGSSPASATTTIVLAPSTIVQTPSPAATSKPPEIPPGKPVVTVPPAVTASPTTSTASTTVATSPTTVATGTVIPGGPNWRWPTDGDVIGRYVAGDQTQQGIDIAGRSGQPVIAAADGVVVYSGAGLVGYGELVIIKHSEEWLSAYAHNRRRLVAEGTKVKAGDAIAEMGRTGAITDMLHFEIRRNGKPVDPLLYLPKK